MAYSSYIPLTHPSSTSIAMEQLAYSSKRPESSPQKDSFLDEFNPANSSSRRSPHKQNIFMAAISFVWKILFLPAVALAYLAFCYVCHFKLVRVGGFSNPMEHLAIIKSGVTSISILVVSISLLPLYSLISDLRSEEFFRTLSGKHSGAPLTTINSISTPSYGTRDSLATLYHGHATGYFAGALVASLIALAASTLAPAALSVDTMLFDGDLMALSVGAIYRNTVMNASDLTQPQLLGPSSFAFLNGPEGGAIAWAEFSLGVNVSFQSPTINQTAYIVPSPLKLAPSMMGRWISDVVVMEPTCEWIAPQFQNPGANFSDFSTPPLITNLTSKNVQVTLGFTEISEKNVGLKPLPGNWFSGLGTGGFGAGGDSVIDLDAMDLTDGATVWMLYQCASGCENGTDAVSVVFGSDINRSRYNSSDGKAVDVAFLYCAPNARIETHQITNDGQGQLTLRDKVPTSQGNLHPVQTNLMLSFLFNGFDSVGPQKTSNVSGFGNEAQYNFMFGKTPVTSTQFMPQSINELSTSYGRLLKSASKPFTDGSMASAFVPGRTTQEIPVYTSSMPHLIASTVLYILFSAFALGCFFRRHVPQFTFFAVAASLARSDIPPLFAQLKESERHGPSSEDGGVTALGGARVLLDGGQVLKLHG